MQVKWTGLTDYVEALEKQMQAQATADARPMIFGLEHPLTITLGRRGDPLKDVLIGFKALRDRNIPVVAVERGGHATMHNPGQLVIYPVISLRKYNLGVKEYVSMLEEVTKELLAQYGITACCKGDEPGLFTIKGKIASYGIRVTRGITSHGVGLNVSNDLSQFQMIRPCGRLTEQFAKMTDFSKVPDLQTLFFQWIDIFSVRLQEKVGRSQLLPINNDSVSSNLTKPSDTTSL